MLFISLLLASIATCSSRTKKTPLPEESVMLGTTIDAKMDSKRQENLQNMLIGKKHDEVPLPQAANQKASVEKTLLIEFGQNEKDEKESGDDKQKLELDSTQVAMLKSSVRSDKTQEVSMQKNYAKTKSAESSKVQSSGKSEGSQKDEGKTNKQSPETDSHATSKLEESSNKIN